MGDQARTDAQVTRELTGLQAMERIREALEDRFEVEVRETVASGADYPQDRLHDYLTGVADGHEPRVRLLFELHDRGALDLGGVLADVPETCFFLGEATRYERSLLDWLGLFGAARPYEGTADDPDELVLYGAGDLVWGRSARRAEDAADFLALLVDEPVAVWRAVVRPEELRVAAVDRWSAREEARIVVPPGLLTAERVREGAIVPLDRALRPRERIIDEL